MGEEVMWVVEHMVADSRPIVVTNPDGSDHALCGFLPLFTSAEQAEAFAKSSGGQPGIKIVTRAIPEGAK